MKNYLALAGAIAAASCVNVDTDPNETGASTSAIVEFDPGNSVIPFPNNLLLDRATGKVSIPAQCGESPLGAALRQLVLNTLDGFGTFKSAMRVTFTEPVDIDTLTDNIKMYRRVSGTTPTDPAVEKDRPVPLVFFPGKTVRYSADCSTNKLVDSVTIVPRIPLAPRSTYSIAVLNGVKVNDGDATFGASSTWGLIRQASNPVTVENGVIISERTALNPAIEADRTTLIGLDLLWKAHAGLIGFLEGTTEKKRGDMVLAWEFNTQTTTTPLDPTVAGTPAAGLPKAALAGVASATGSDTPAAHMEAVLVSLGAPAGICTLLSCAATVSAVLDGNLTSPNFQMPGANAGFGEVPGSWSSPVSPTKVSDATLPVRIVVPMGTRPATGWPTIVFGHGLGGGRLFSYFIASQLASQGFATVSIDFVASAGRAVRTSDDAARGCGGTPNPLAAPQCFAPILSTNIATTRDNIRQSVLDVQTLIQSLRMCTVAAPCGTFAADGAKIGYLGISLGGIIGSVIVASDPAIKAAVLNVPGAGLVDILENTNTLAIRCSTVDGLIDAGIITGTKWNGMNGDDATGTCTDSEWKADPGYQSFANTARWVLDSADGANFGTKLAARRILIQEVEDDQVVPNIGTDQLAALSGFTVSAAGDTLAPVDPLPPSAAIATDPMTRKWLRYTTLASPANYTFLHGSLLGQGSQLGVARIQTDAIAYLVANVKL